MLGFFVKDIQLSDVRHNDLKHYVEEGFGGLELTAWPVYSFFKQYADGDPVRAKQNFIAWYMDQLEKYHDKPKKDGGMFQGSLYALVEKHCREPFGDTSDVCRRQAIQKRVEQRLVLLREIERHGYDPSKERIHGIKKKGKIYLTGGHHRAAILLALGKTILPQVLVFPNTFIYNLVYFLRNK